jgi:hypothetical protein
MWWRSYNSRAFTIQKRTRCCSTIHSKKKIEKNATRVECMNVLTDFLRKIRQKKKKEVSRALIDRLFFFLLEYLNNLTYMYDLDHEYLFAHFISRRFMLNRYYFDSNLDSMWKKKERKRFYSIFISCRSIIIIEEY